MRPNIVSEAGLRTRASQWWEAIPFLTSSIVIICGTIYLVCLLVGYDSFFEVCFLPSQILSKFQVYRFYTSIVFHGSVLHVMFNMLALAPLGSELERIMGSVRLLYIVILLATSNSIFHLLISVVGDLNPIHDFGFMNECAIGFSGVLFSMIVIETSLSGGQHRSVFGLFNVPSRWYPWVLLVLFQLLAPNVSLLGHLCGILSGFAYTYGAFNLLIPGPSIYSAIESSSWFSSCVRRPKFIVYTGGNPSGYIPTHTSQNSTSSGLISGNLWRNLSSWMPQRGSSVAETTQDSRFPGQGRTLAANQNSARTTVDSDSDSSLQTRLLENSSPDLSSNVAVIGAGHQDGRHLGVENTQAVTRSVHQAVMASEEEIQKLVSMGFEETQVEVALAAADGDINVALEILMTQQG